MFSKFIIATTPGKEKTEEKDVLEIDRDFTVQAILSLGVQPVRIVGEEFRLAYQFDAKEVEEIRNKLLSNQPIMVDFHQVVMAVNSWKDAVTLWKAEKKKRQYYSAKNL